MSDSDSSASPVAEAVDRGASRLEVERLVRDRFARGLARLDDVVVGPAPVRASTLVSEPRTAWVPRIEPDTGPWADVPEWDALQEALEYVPAACRVYHEPGAYSHVGQPGAPDWGDPDDRQTYYDEEVVVSDPYARTLDAVRARRLEMEARLERPPTRDELADAHVPHLALPEDVMAAAAAVPFVCDWSILLLPNPSIQESWREAFGAHAEIDVHDRITRRGHVSAFRHGVFHQIGLDTLQSSVFDWWVYYCLKDWPDAKASRELFYTVVRIEQDGPCEDRVPVLDDMWAADLAQELIGPSGADLQWFAVRYPVRATVLARALESALNSALGSEWRGQNTFHAALRARVRTIAEEIAPLARATLIERAHVGDAGTASAAAALLLFLGTRDDLQRLPPVETLDARCLVCLTDEEMPKIASLSALRHLDLTGLGDAALKALWGDLLRLPLETLVLRGARSLTNGYLAPLCLIPSLRSLDVSGTLVNDGAVPALAAMHLESLDISNTRFTRDGVQALSARLPRTRITFY